MSKSCVLIVEDDLDLREALRDTLSIGGYQVLEASNGQIALELLERETVRMVISDVQMPGMDGHTLLRQIRQRDSDLPVIIMTAFGSVQKAVEAMQSGAIDYLVKPFEAQVLLNTIARYVPSSEEIFHGAIAEDVLTKEVLNLARRVGESDATILISGESGCGKEVFAREIHRSSPRANGPFIAINCAAIPENMLEAMLFGYEKGAFTGAYKSSPGKFEQANGGTLLLDEISEMDMALQAKLLRVLQEREVERLGGQEVIALDVRVLATTNRNMRKEVEEGHFREDLFYRLNVFPIQVPPLRERRGDIIPLFRHLIVRHISKSNKPIPTVTSEACEKLLQHRWPGNVRELENVVQRALILHRSEAIQIQDVMFEAEVYQNSNRTEPMEIVLPDTEDNGDLSENLKVQEFQLILDALKLFNGNRKRAADKLGISERTLRYKMARMRDSGFELPRRFASEEMV